MKLYKIEASNWETFFGTSEEPIERDVRIIAQTPSNDAFLLLTIDTFDQLDDIYHNGIDAWKATIKVTKDKYPKR